MPKDIERIATPTTNGTGCGLSALSSGR